MRIAALHWTALATALAAMLAAVPAEAGRIAVTVDDLPLYGSFAGDTEAEAVTTALLDGFRRNRWRVTGFVNEVQLEGTDRAERISLLRRWLAAGEDLGNHTYSHVSLTTTPLVAFEADVVRGEAVTKALLAARGRRERWFRHPYLETGPTLDVRRGFEVWLASRGYRVAPVSMENSDWQFADAYDEALMRGDAAAADRIRAEYLSFTARVVPWYRAAAKGLLGREPAFVLLLHASRLNSASVDALAGILRYNYLRPVTLDRAMRDPAYAIPERHVGPDGDEWVTRWADDLKRPLPYATLPHVPDDIASTGERTVLGNPDPSYIK